MPWPSTVSSPNHRHAESMTVIERPLFYATEFEVAFYVDCRYLEEHVWGKNREDIQAWYYCTAYKQD